MALHQMWRPLLSHLSNSQRRRSIKRRRCQLSIETLETRVTPASHVWTGLGLDNLWSNPQNWTNGSPASDASGDIDLVFHTNLTSTANLVTQNDIVGLVVDSITFDANPGMIGPTTFATGGTSSDGYTINGNTILINTSGAGQDPFGIDIATGVADPTNGITQTFFAGISLFTADATFRSQESLARLTFTGPVDLGTQTLTIDNLGLGVPGMVISGDISNGDLIKNGSGTLDLSGNSTYADTTVNGGVILVRSDTALGVPVVGTVTVNDPAQVRLVDGVTVVKPLLNLNSNTSGGGLGANGNTTNTFRGNVVLMAGVGGVALGAGNGAANADTRLIIDGVISGATSTLFINGAGTVQFTSNNTYTGITQINGNQGFTTVQIDAPAGLGAGGDADRTNINNGGGGQPGGTVALNFNGTLQDAANVPEEIDFAGSGVGALGAIRSLGNANVIIPGDITFIAAAPWVFAVDGAAGSITLTGIIDSQGANRALTKIGPGTLIVGGAAANVYQGGVFVNEGLLSVQNTSATPLGLLAGLRGGLVTVNDTGTLRVEAGVTAPNPGQVNTGGSALVDGTLGNVQLNGGTLGGVGTVGDGNVLGDAISATGTGGVVNPGDGLGILNTNGNVTWNASTTFSVDLARLIASPALLVAGTDYDQLLVNGDIFLGDASLAGIIDQFGVGIESGDAFTIIESTGSVSGSFAQGGSVVIGGFSFTIDYQPTRVVLTAAENATTTVVTSSANPSLFGQTVTFTATVSAVIPSSGTPSGDVIFTVDGNPQAPVALDANGEATLTTSVLTVGSHTIEVAYLGNANFTISDGSVIQDVDPAALTPSVTNATTDENVQTTSGLVISRNPANGAEVTHFKITNITNGSLFLNDGTTPISNNQFITFAQGDAGLRFTPAPNSTATGQFTVQASLNNTNAGLGGSTVTASITVTGVNDAPSITPIPNKTANVGSRLRIDVQAQDPDLPADKLTFSLDGASLAAGMKINPNTGVFLFQPNAAQANRTFAVTVTVNDGQGGTDTESFNVLVPAIPTVTSNGTIVNVVGTTGNDSIVINQANGQLFVFAFIGEVRVKIFSAQNVQAIFVNAGAGNDAVVLTPSVTIPSTLLGGAGNDVLRGGSARDVVLGGAGDDLLVGNAGNDILLGGNGNDVMFGGAGNDVLAGNAGNDRLFGELGNDILIGGLGQDLLNDSSGTDLLIGGSTANEGRAQALAAAMTDWIANRKQAAISKLGAYSNDKVKDTVTGDLRGDTQRL